MGERPRQIHLFPSAHARLAAAFADMVIKSTIRGRRKEGRKEGSAAASAAMVSAAVSELKWEGRMRHEHQPCGKAKKQLLQRARDEAAEFGAQTCQSMML